MPRFGLLLCVAILGLLVAPRPSSGQEAEQQQIGTPVAVAARPALIPTAMFAARSPFGRAIVAPDGKHIAMLVEIEGNENIAVMDVATRKFVSRTTLDLDGEAEWFRWAGNRRVIISLSGADKIYDVDVRFTRLYVTDIEKMTTTYVGNRSQGLVGDDVVFVDPDGEFVLLSMQKSIWDDPEVRKFRLDGSNTDTDERIQSRKAGVWTWIADDAGVVRVGLGWSSGRLRVYYRKTAQEDFRVIARFTGKDGKEEEEETELWDALRIIKDSDNGFVLRKGPGGKLALLNFNYATREAGETVYENPDWDLTDFALDDDGKPLAAYYTDDRDRIVWFDPRMARLQQNLETALGGKEAWISSRAKDDSVMMVWSGSASDPGALYLFTPAKGTLDLLADLRPGMPLDLLAEVKPIRYSARDGTRISAYLTLPLGREAKGLPLIILPHGGPYGVRDKLDYNDEVQFLANRGYAVLQPNFRGSDGYGEPFVQLGDGQIGRAMQDDLDDAMDWAVSEGIADPGRVCVVGSSYGGYAALWAVIRNPERYRCAASFAGVTDWAKQLRYDAGFFSRKGGKQWRTRVRGEDRSFDLDAVSPAHQAARLTRPILLAQGKRDNNVPYNQFKALRDALEKTGFESASYLVFEEGGHGFSTPEDEKKWYDALETFLTKNNPPD
jgi:dipeptidyl aminopeptidase/acylaminoacyl peptidase